MTETKKATTANEQPDDELSPAERAAEKEVLERNRTIAAEASQAVGRGGAGRTGNRVEVFKGRGGNFYVRVFAANGEETWRTSEGDGYENAGDAVAVAASSFPTLPLVDLTKEKSEK